MCVRSPCRVLLFALAFGLIYFGPVLADDGTKRLEGDRITLVYPSALFSDREARLLLEDREEALAWVEKTLQLQYEGRLIVTFQWNWFAEAWWTECRGRTRKDRPRCTAKVTYIIGDPDIFLRYVFDPDLQGRSPAHELTHAVSIQQLGFPGDYLSEGLAGALDLSHRALESAAHLISKGLLQRGELPPIRLAVREISPFEYDPAVSFVLFLLREYGLDRFKELYATAAAAQGEPGFARRSETQLQQIEEKVQDEVRRIYGKDLRVLQEEWRSFLTEFAPGEEQRALHLVEAYEEFVKIWQLRANLRGWSEAGYLSPAPEKLTQQFEDVRSSLRSLGDLEAPTSPEELYAEFQEKLKVLQSSLDACQRAPRNFLDAKERIYAGADYDVIISKLREAQRLYSQVGDRVMAAKMGKYLEGFRLVQEGERWIRGIGCPRGQDLLRRAQEIFQELQEFSLVERVQEILTQESSCRLRSYMPLLFLLAAVVLLIVWA